MTIDEILELMDGLLEKSTAVPFSSKKMIDCDQMREYIDSIRLNMPEEIAKAKETEAEQKSIIAQAHRDAEQIVRKAEERAKAMVAQEEIIKQAKEVARDEVKRAKEEAEGIVADARAKEKSIRQALSTNLEKTLSEAEKVLSKSLADVTSTKAAVINVGKKS
ncbi:MAG: hypothetical protein IJ746_03985 [Ruminococcus sp.]|nr:hypothetical protein [Ruminococcus sp.]